MKEARGNVWDWINKVQVVFITTNLEIRRDGTAVMGAGQALHAAKSWPMLAERLGIENARGNTLPAKLHEVRGQPCLTELWSFPVKGPGKVIQDAAEERELVLTRHRGKYVPGNYCPSWAQKASMDMIIASAQAAQALPHQSFVLPRPGCGFGGLSWDDVGPVLHEILDDRFTSVTF